MTKTINTKELEVYNYLRENEQTDVDFINQKLDNNPNNQLYNILKARILIKKMELKKAKKILNRVKGKLKEEYQPYFHLAKAELKLKLGDEIKGRIYLHKSLLDNPYFTEALELLMENDVLIKNYIEVIQILEATPKKYMSSRLRFYLGKAYFLEDELTLSKVELKKSMKEYPNWESDIMLGYIETKQLNPDLQKALEYFNSAFKKNPNKKDPVVALSTTYLKCGNYKKAQEFQILCRDIEIEIFIKELNKVDFDLNDFVDFREPPLLAEDVLSCILFFINHQYVDSIDLIDNHFYWEDESNGYNILSLVINSFLEGNKIKFNQSKWEIIPLIGSVLWELLEEEYESAFKIHNRDLIIDNINV